MHNTIYTHEIITRTVYRAWFHFPSFLGAQWRSSLMIVHWHLSKFLFSFSFHEFTSLGLAHGALHLRILFLQLQEQRRIFDFDEVIDVLEASLHQGHLALHRVVPEGYGLAHSVLWARNEVAREQLNELVLDVLDEVQLGRPISIHNEHGEERVRFLDARVDHFDQDVGVVGELNHQLLVLLHVTEAVFVDDVRVVEEQIVLTSQLDLDVLESAGLVLL